MRVSPLARPLLLLAVTLLAGLAFAGPRAVAQTASQHTTIKLFIPWDGSKLNPALTVRARVDFVGNPNINNGSCQSESIATPRLDAWRCLTADPCFVPLFGDQTTLACASEPWSNEVTLLNVPPLPDFDQCRQPPLCRQPTDLTKPPWAIELANGARCTRFTGTISPVAGIGMLYGCRGADGASALAGAVNGVDRNSPMWNVFYYPNGALVAEQVDILVAWY